MSSKPYLPNFVKETDDGSLECKLCTCNFFSYADFKAHMDRFGVEHHIENMQDAHKYRWNG